MDFDTYPARLRLGALRAFAALALGLAGLSAPGLALAAHTSSACAPKTGAVTQGGTVTIDVTDCTPFGIGFAASGPVDGNVLPSHGAANLRIDGSRWLVDYSHNGNSATSDVFEFVDGTGNEVNDSLVEVTITITPATSAITVAPATLPTLTAGAPFSQTLTSSGGNAPYSYTLQSGSLPPGLSLTSGGVLSGTPTQRGNYSFSVRSTDATSDVVDKGYTGTVQNPSLALVANSGTAIQSAAFSQTLAVNGGVAPYSFLLETGSFPAGISISSAGVISGTTTAAPGNYPVTLRVTDASTGIGQYFELENFTLTVSPPPSVTIAATPASRSEDGATNFSFTVTRSLALSSPTVVNITTGGTATSGTDYTGGVATVTIPAGATTATWIIDPTLDATVEADETVILTVAAGAGYTVGATPSATVTILNDDLPFATMSVSPAAVAEDGAPNLVFRVTLDQANLTATSVAYTISGTAANGSDYATIASPLLIPAGNTTGTITVNPTADATIEGDETVTLTLAAGSNYVVSAPTSATGTILNDDLPNLVINDVTLSEGNAGTTNFTYTVSLSAPAGPGGVTFNIATANGSATAGVDYVASSLTGQTIPAGSSTYTFTVAVNGDLLNEPSETFFVNVTSVVNAVVVDGQGVGTITNDDPLPSLSIDDVTVVEGNAGTVNAVFSVSLSAASGQTVGVNYASADGTATQPADYTATSGTLTFTPGQTVRTITVPVIGEAVPEANEVFFVNLSGASNATIADNQGAGTISNDDVPVTVAPATLPDGTVAVAYAQSLTASGGTAPYSFALTAGALPSGMTLSPSGVLAGTPTSGGSFNFTVTATDASAFPGPFAGNRAYTLVVAAPTISLPAASLADGTVGAAYAEAVGPASGGTAPYSYAVTAGALPPGLLLDTSTGAITGTASAAGTFSFSVTATDSSTGTGPYTATQAYAIEVIDLPPIAADSTLSVGYGAPATAVTLSLSGGAASALAITAPPQHGTAIVAGTTITYQPDAGFAGADSFAYTASNGGGTSAPATVSVTVADPSFDITADGPLTATLGVPFTRTFTFSGGAQPWGAYAVNNLPAGLAITASTPNSVTISGSATEAGVFPLAVGAQDASTGNGPFMYDEQFVLTVPAPVITLSPSDGSTFDVPYAQPFSLRIAGNGGLGPYTYSAAGLPPGLFLVGDTITGELEEGRPGSPMAYAVRLTVFDSGTTGAGAPFGTSVEIILFVIPPDFTISPATLPPAVAGQPYSQQLTATGGFGFDSGQGQFDVFGGRLPAGLTLSRSGLISGTPTESGTATFGIRAVDALLVGDTQAFTLQVDVPTLTLAPASLPAGTAGQAYSQVFAVDGGIAPYASTLTGTLPAGLVFDPATRTLSGTPTQAGSFALQFTATDATTGTAATITRGYTLEIASPTLAVTPAAGALPAGVAGQPYSRTFAASGGIAPYAWSLTGGALPAGLAFNGATGTLSGTPTVAGSFAFTVTVTDATTGQPGTLSQSYTLELATPSIAVGPADLPQGTRSIPYAQTLAASGGTGPYAFALSAGALPPGVTLANGGALSGTPTAEGSFAFTVIATDALGFTGTRAYALVVSARPDPTLDPDVRGLLDAQRDAARRFADGQVQNLHQRMQRLHGAARTGGFSASLSVAATPACRSTDSVPPGLATSACAAEGAAGAASGDAPRARAPQGDDTGLGTWIAGGLRSGSLDAEPGRAALDLESDGISAGIDRRFGERVVAGVSLGLGRDRTDVGEAGSRSDADALSVAVYASMSPGERVFVDALLGYQALDFDLRRRVSQDGALLSGQRDGAQWFGSVSVGADLAFDAWQLTPYARLDVARGELDGYDERGASVFALRHEAMDIETLTGSAGLRLDYHRPMAWGVLVPRFSAEFQHDAADAGTAGMRYLDLLLQPAYRTELERYQRNRWMLGAGVGLDLSSGWTLRLDYRVQASGDGSDDGVQFGIDTTF